MRRLEARVGRPLLERGRGAIGPTAVWRPAHARVTALLAHYARVLGRDTRIRRGRPDDRHLRAVVAIAEHASVGTAAAALELSTSATSGRLAVVERHLGRSIFERRHGMRVRRGAEGLVQELRALVLRHDDVVTLLVERRDRLAIGVLTASDPPVAAAVLAAHRASGASVRSVRVFTDERLRLLRTGVIDAAFVRVPPDLHADLTGLRLEVDDLVAALPDALAPPVGAAVALSDVNALGLHWYVEGQNQWFEDQLAAAVARTGSRLDVVSRNVGPFPNLTEVASGRGATLVSRSLSGRLTLEGVAYRELTQPLPLVVLSLVHRRGDETRPELRALLDAASGVIRSNDRRSR